MTVVHTKTGLNRISNESVLCYNEPRRSFPKGENIMQLKQLELEGGGTLTVYLRDSCERMP